VKDLLDTAGLITTYGSIIFAEHVPARNAAAVDQLEAAGYGVAGKTNLHEFAYGISSQNEHFGPACRRLERRVSRSDRFW
jgi:Asp-tRNA(Asn)/Glu-tRNA(Gln) amidotransferase A subunit family amidase